MIGELKENWDHYKLCCGYDRENPSVLNFLFMNFKYKYWDLVCKLKGHDWVDNSYGNPETGCIEMECKRCGYYFHETLY